jgi:hypothetical protein
LQPVELAFGPDLLCGADHRIDQPDPHGDQRVGVAAKRSRAMSMTNRIEL